VQAVALLLQSAVQEAVLLLQSSAQEEEYRALALDSPALEPGPELEQGEEQPQAEPPVLGLVLAQGPALERVPGLKLELEPAQVPRPELVPA